MTKIIIFRIAVFSIFILISCLLSANYQDMIGFALVLSIGLIHGANDLLIIKKNSNDVIVIADGTSCRCQIKDGLNKEAIHLAKFMDENIIY